MRTKDPLETFVVAGVAALFLLGSPVACAQSETQIDEEVAEAEKDASSRDEAVAGAPTVAETYQRSINRGWEKAVAGETPAYACAGLKGRVIGTGEAPEPEAVEALYACNVLLPVRYFETHLDRVEAGEISCYDFSRDMSIQIGAMTMSIDDIGGMVEALADASGDEEVQAEAETMSDLVADAATLEEGLEDPERAIKDLLAERVRAVCPDSADSILR